jgi:virulence factor
MRIALFGLGDIACKAYLPVVANHPDVTPILCTRDPQRLATLARQYRVQEAYSTLDDLIASRPDAVMIHSATETHATVARALLMQGIPVFVDKPLSYQLAECEALLELAAASQVSLTMGFNRRFAPLIQPLGQCQSLVHAQLQKNRTGLPADPRVFIFDDFIHVLDTLRYIAPGEVAGLQVHAYRSSAALSAVHVQWTSGSSLLTGSMNRISGLTEERLEVFATDQKWQIDQLTHGTHAHAVNTPPSKALGFSDWDSTLHKRGFVAMFAAFLAQLQAGRASDYADILATHQLCERVVTQIIGAD